MVEKKLKEIMAATFSCKVSEINSKSSINRIKRWDSLRHFKLILNIEKKLKIKFNDGEAETLTSYKILLATIKSHNE